MFNCWWMRYTITSIYSHYKKFEYLRLEKEVEKYHERNRGDNSHISGTEQKRIPTTTSNTMQVSISDKINLSRSINGDKTSSLGLEKMLMLQ